MAEQKSWQRPLRIRMSIWVFLSTLDWARFGVLNGFPPHFPECVCAWN